MFEYYWFFETKSGRIRAKLLMHGSKSISLLFFFPMILFVLPCQRKMTALGSKSWISQQATSGSTTPFCSQEYWKWFENDHFLIDGQLQCEIHNGTRRWQKIFRFVFNIARTNLPLQRTLGIVFVVLYKLCCQIAARRF